MSKPTVFISSTCRDLAAYRERIVGRLGGMGLVPVYSESSEFPVKQSVPALESCYAAVEDASDVMVLVLGSRYGSVDENGLSVTHNEYRRARAAGIPVLVLVDQVVLDLIPIVKKNPDMDLSGTVDDKRLFEFVDELLTHDKRWVFAYSNLDDVEGVVVHQLAVLFGECLSLYRQLSESEDSDLLRLMGSSSRKILLAKGDLWEYDLLQSLLWEYFGSTELRFMELELQYGYGRETLEIDEDDVDLSLVSVEFSASCRRVIHLLRNWSALINNALNDALGAPGVAGEAPKLVFTARRLADVYGEFLAERNRMARYERVEKLEGISRAFGTMLTPGLEYIRDTPSLWQERVAQIRYAIGNDVKSLDLSFEIPEFDGDDFDRELKHLVLVTGV